MGTGNQTGEERIKGYDLQCLTYFEKKKKAKVARCQQFSILNAGTRYSLGNYTDKVGLTHKNNL